MMLVLMMMINGAQAREWTLDSAHTQVGFRVSHMMVSSVEGRFSGVTGTMEFEPGQLNKMRVQVSVDMATVTTNNEKRDGHLRSPEFFDVEAFSTMTFVTTKVKSTKKGTFEMTGDLTIRGVTKKVTFDGAGLSAVVTDPWGNDRVGARATTTINRQDFGVSWNSNLDAGGVVVGDEVELRLDVEFTGAKQ